MRVMTNAGFGWNDLIMFVAIVLLRWLPAESPFDDGSESGPPGLAPPFGDLSNLAA
jgi:hypothetical protein